MTDPVEVRRCAYAAITAVERDGAWSTTAINDAVDTLADARDRRFAAHLAYDTIRWQGPLDVVLGFALERPINRVEPALRRVLHLGLHQLLHMRVEAHAAVDTSVELAKTVVPRKRARAAAAFVNGVLRNVGRHPEWSQPPDEVLDSAGHLAYVTAHPVWIVDELLNRFDRQRVCDILVADNDAPGVTLRAVGHRDELIEQLRLAGHDAQPGRSEYAIRVPGADPRRLRAVATGQAVVQDEASMRVVEALGLRPGDRILDLCAGPGGKAAYAAQLAQPGGTVVAVEFHHHRATLIEQLARRLNVPIEVHTGDARTWDGSGGPFDIVLVDAPCTGLGTGRRRPEVRWRRTPGDITALAQLQHELLDAASRQVRSGGRLGYAVCTWTAAETVEVIDRFTQSHPRFAIQHQRQLWPDLDGTDGMFFAVLEDGNHR
ncbi:MAG: transcription antitermination factor NusB [Nitriliruptoraceae bacterium]